MRILTIIVTYNGMKWIENCLVSLDNSSVRSDIFVVDNCSTDGTRDFIKKRFPHVHLVASRKNLGFGQGNNLGMRYALDNGYDYVLLLNQDAYLQKNALERMLAVTDGHSLLSPMHMNGDGSAIDFYFTCAIKQADKNLMDAYNSENPVITSFSANDIPAACWFMPRNVLERIGGFNPLFFQYGEDNQYIQRMNYHQINRRIVVDAKVFHDRKGHGCANVFNQGEKHRDFLLIVCNPNFSILKIILLLIRLLLRYYVYGVRRGTYRVGMYSMELVWTLKSWRHIADSRQVDKQIGCNWL